LLIKCALSTPAANGPVPVAPPRKTGLFGEGLSTGIYYQWTPNGLVLGIVAVTCAFGATVLLGDLFRLLRFIAASSRK
jgi:hypothetical protein